MRFSGWFSMTGAIWNRVKVIWVSSWLAFNTLLVALPIFFSTLGRTTGNFAFTMSRVWAWLLLQVTGVKVVVRGRRHIAPGQPYIIISNHRSHFDGPALAVALGIQFRWIAKKELLRIPLFGRCLRLSRNIFIDRSNRQSAIESINTGVAALPPGVSVMCFAEGTRAVDSEVGPFKKGCFAAALRHGLPILPVSVRGSERILPKGTVVVSKGIIELAIAEPIATEGMGLEAIDDLVAKTRHTIVTAL